MEEREEHYKRGVLNFTRALFELSGGRTFRIAAGDVEGHTGGSRGSDVQSRAE